MYFVGKNTLSETSWVQCTSPKGGFCTVSTSPSNSDLLLVSGRNGRKYSIWMRQANNSWIGEKMFILYGFRVVVTDEKVHVWIKRLGGSRPYRRRTSRSYTGSRYRGPMYTGGRRQYSRYMKRSAMNYKY